MKIYCSYQDCLSVREAYSSTTLFQIPKYGDPRRDIWINNSGNPYLKTIKHSTRCFFCEKHFDPKMIRRQFNRTTLNKFAVPEKYKRVDEQFETDNAIIGEQSGSTTYEILFNNSENSNVTLESNDDTKNYEESESVLMDNHPVEIIKMYSNKKNKTKDDFTNLPSKQIIQDLEIKPLEGSFTNETNFETAILNINNIIDLDPQRASSRNNYELNADSLSNEIFFKLNNTNDVSKPEINSEASNDELASNSENSNVANDGNIIKSNLKIGNCNCKKIEKESDKYFLLSLLDNFQRLSYQQKSIAKIEILKFLNSLENNLMANLSYD